MTCRLFIIKLSIVISIALPVSNAFAQAHIPNAQSRLYYRIGGSDPASRAAK